MRFPKKTFILVLLLIKNSLLFCQPKYEVKFDGLYQTAPTLDSASNLTFYGYLRFYSNGKVIMASSSVTPLQLKKWFKSGHPNILSGFYKINKDKIYFKIKAKKGAVIYDGQILDQNRLKFSIKSLINGNRSNKTYQFVALAGMD
jgi:hypothetical protein